MNNSTDLLGFNLLYKLGQGAFSTTYLAEQNGKMVAIKVIEIPNPTTSRDMSHEMFLSKEFQANLRHTCANLNELLKCVVGIDDQKGLLKYHDYKLTLDRNTGVYQLSVLVEYLESFCTYSRKNKLTVRKILKMYMDLCESLQVMNDLGFPHGNIKETNIFYDNIKGFKLGDFFLNDILINTLKPRETYSDYGYRFLAPEAYDIGEYSYKTDIFILSMLVYKILNNSLLPFEYEGEVSSQKEIREKFLANRTLPPSPLIPSPVYDILRKATAYNPNDRYNSFIEMKEDIRSAMKAISFDELERTVDYKFSTDNANYDIPPSPTEPLPKEPTTVSYEISLQNDEPNIGNILSDKPVGKNTDDYFVDKNDQPEKEDLSYTPGPNEQKILEEKTVNVSDKTVTLGVKSKKVKPTANSSETNAKKNKKNKKQSKNDTESPPLYTYYDDEDDDDEEYATQNWITTIMVILGIAILCIAAVFLLPLLEDFFRN